MNFFVTAISLVLANAFSLFPFITAKASETSQDLAFLPSPNTGDESNVFIFVIIAVVAVAALIGMKIYMNKMNKK